MESSGCPIPLVSMTRPKSSRAGTAWRRRCRERIGRLRDRVISPRTLDSYKRAAKRYLEFCLHSLGRFPRSTREVDRYMSGYVEHVWEEGDPTSWAQTVVSAMTHFEPELRQELHGTRRLLKAWGRLENCDRATPLPTEYAMALAGVALERRQVRLAVALMVAFHAMLRTGEILTLQVCHFVMPLAAGPVVLALEETKCSQRRGIKAESVVLTDPTLIGYLRVVLPRLRPGERLYGGSGYQFREDVRSLCYLARLPAANWRPYSLRRGGATAHFLEFGSLDRTAVRGRWTSVQTARIYIDEGVATLAQLIATDNQRARIQHLARLVPNPQ